jgi:hypothetical protein
LIHTASRSPDCSHFVGGTDHDGSQVEEGNLQLFQGRLQARRNLVIRADPLLGEGFVPSFWT